MQYLIIIIISIILIIILKYIFEFDLKKIKSLEKNKDLDNIAKKYPDNVAICKKYLRILNNENVIIEENKETETSLYIAITNKISIGNIQKSYSRIQTIAHECVHSVQSRKILMFNFIFSNIYIVYFILICILGIIGVLNNKEIYLTILTILSLIYYMVRSYLENDAMIRAPYLTKQYMKNANKATKSENKELLKGFEEITNIGVKVINYNLIVGILVKILILTVIFWVR